MREPQGDDTVLWPDGTECYFEDLEDYLSFMSDDFEIIPLIDI